MNDELIRIELEHIRRVFSESDRGCMLLTGASLDDSLGLLHKSHIGSVVPASKKLLKELFRPYAPLSSFKSRIDLAYAYGLISQEDRDDLEVIRELRNEAAHTTNDFTFQSEEIRTRVLKLRAGHRAPEELPRFKRMLTPEDLKALDAPDRNVKMFLVINGMSLTSMMFMRQAVKAVIENFARGQHSKE